MAIAIVQSGVAGPDEVQQFSALGSLYHEPLSGCSTAAKSGWNASGLLAGKRLGVGPTGSGTHAIAMEIAGCQRR